MKAIPEDTSLQQMSSQLTSRRGCAQKDYQYYSGLPVVGLTQFVGYSPMQAAQGQGNSGVSHNSYYQHVQDAGSYGSPQNFQSLNNRVSSDESSQGTHFSARTSSEQYCTLESSSATGVYSFYNSPSTLSISPNGSPLSHQESQSIQPDSLHSPYNTYGSPVSASCLTDDDDLKHKLRELQTAMLGQDFVDCFDNDQALSAPNKWEKMMDLISRGDLKQVLIACAQAVADEDSSMAQKLIAELRKMVSVSGEPIERLGAYLLEGIVARLSSSGSAIYKSLRCREPTSSELLSYMHLLYEVCPFFKFGYMSANGAIAEALKDENQIHIIDFQIAQGSQWITLIQALAARPGGPPCIRVTGIDDSQSAYARGGGLEIVGKRLAKLAESCNVPFEFNAAEMSCCGIELENLGIRPMEAIAVNFPYMLHHIPDESVSTENHRDRLLRLVKRLSPKVVTLVEQESNTNTAPFFPRFLETLNYYTAMFESIDVTLARDHKERINVEQHCLARDIVNIIACEGAERVERHELLGKWKSRFRMAGFTPYPLSSVVNVTIKTLLENYCKSYTLEEREGALYLGWKNRDLVVSCAWR